MIKKKGQTLLCFATLFEKIPVTPKQWIQILKFINEISQAEHVDVEHSFRYLVHSDGFEFCSSFELENVGDLTKIDLLR